jgi:hypothetical protein
MGVTQHQVQAVSGGRSRPAAGPARVGVLRRSDDEADVPWQRVVNAAGGLSTHKLGFGDLQAALLRAERGALALARTDVRLREVARFEASDGRGSFAVFTVAGAQDVYPLAVAPVLDGGDGPWWERAALWAARLPNEGGEGTPAMVEDTAAARELASRWGDEVAYEPVAVSGVVVGDGEVRFSVDRPGVPVYVAVNWSSRWEADGANGPVRAAPGGMVVVPTESDVTLTFARPVGERLGALWGLATVLAGGAGMWARRRRSFG